MANPRRKTAVEPKEVFELDPAEIAERKRMIAQVLLKRAGMARLVTFLEKVLEYPPFAEVHEEIDQFLKGIRRGLRRGLLLIPRGHLKSTTVTVGYVTQRIVENPDIRVLITNAELENSKGFLREIKQHFERGEKLRETYGNFVSDTEKWSETQIVVSQRRKVLKEPTVQATSLDKSVVSQHYDLIVADDLVNRNTVSTAEQRQKVILYLKDLLDLLEPDGEIILIGTRWHHADLYGHLMEKDPDLWKVFLRTCWKDKEKRIPLFPKFTADYLDQLRREKGAYEFSGQYLNSPTDDETALFRPEWFRRFEPTELDGRGYNVFVAIDPAWTMDEHNDATGIAEVAVTSDGRAYVLSGRRIRVNPTVLVEELFLIARKYGRRLKGFGIEATSHLMALRPAIEMKEKEYGMRLDITDLSPYTRKKKERITALVPLVEQGMMLFSPDAEHAVEELLAFPRAQHEDVADALGYVMEIAHGRGLPEDGSPVPAGPTRVMRAKTPSRR